jgi:hypothetical protein
MHRICPKAQTWHMTFRQLQRFARSNECVPPSPPTPLILSGWIYSTDVEKMERWGATVEWAKQNGCAGLVGGIPDADFYEMSRPNIYQISPTGRPMRYPWSFERKSRPSNDEIARYLQLLQVNWAEVVGAELASYTQPLAFTGQRLRRIVVQAEAMRFPPWGTWSHLSENELERRTFTVFRAALNRCIAPHAVDHVQFRVDA